MQTKNRNGFTILELLVVLTISSIFLGISIPSLRDFIIEQQLQEVAWQIVQDMRLSKESAILYQQDLKIYFCTEPDTSRNFYLFETFLKDPLKNIHYTPGDQPDGIHFVKRELKYNTKFTANVGFKELGWINGKYYHYLTFYCGKDNHFRGQPNSFGTIEITNSTNTKKWYVIVDIAGRIRMSGSPPSH